MCGVGKPWAKVQAKAKEGAEGLWRLGGGAEVMAGKVGCATEVEPVGEAAKK